MEAVENKEKDKHSGIPMSEAEYAEWQGAFSEIEEISASLKKVKVKKK